jgi:hypothetical protein
MAGLEPARPRTTDFKVPHHGSDTGHHAQIPVQLLDTEPLAVVAPFKNGNVSLPKPTDVTRIIGYAPNSFTTSNLAGRANPRRPTAVEKAIREVTKRFSTIKAEAGMIRLRKQAGSTQPWTVEEFGSASHLSQIY